MTEKTRKILAWACLTYSGILSLLYILTIAVPAMPEIAHRTWIDHLKSLWSIYLSFYLGHSLLRGKLEGSAFMRLMISVILFCPLLPLVVVQYAFRIGQPLHGPFWGSWIQSLLLVLAMSAVIIPYALGDRVLKSLTARGARRRVTPAQGLFLIGMFCSIMPSTVGGWLLLLGIEKQTVYIYYLVGISYVATTAWWVWWKHRYFGKSEVV